VLLRLVRSGHLTVFLSGSARTPRARAWKMKVEHARAATRDDKVARNVVVAAIDASDALTVTSIETDRAALHRSRPPSRLGKAGFRTHHAARGQDGQPQFKVIRRSPIAANKRAHRRARPDPSPTVGATTGSER